MTNAHDKRPRQMPWQMLMTNAHDNRPMSNAHDKHHDKCLCQTPKTNAHDKCSWQTPMTKNPCQIPMTNQSVTNTVTNVYVKCPRQMPMSNIHDNCPWQMPISNNNNKWPWQTTMPFCHYTHVVDFNFNTICMPFSRGHLIFETSNLFLEKWFFFSVNFLAEKKCV